MTTPDKIEKDVLHERLSSICPDPTVPKRSRIPALARRMEMTSAGVYKWINEGKVPPARVPELVRMQEEVFGRVRVTAGQLNPIFSDRNKS